MSKESSQWLNNNVLVGFTEKRGHAWHYKADDQGAEPNHYPGAIPVEDVRRRLMAWKAVELPVCIPVPCTIDEAETMDASGHPVRYVVVPNRKAIARDDTYLVLGVHAEGYQPHQYFDWLVGNVANLLATSSDGLGVGSAGLLKGGARAWVQLEMPDNVTTPQGVDFRPNLLAFTSFDGSFMTSYMRTVGIAVCDNTLAGCITENDDVVKVRHTSNSMLRIADAQEALSIVTQTADDFAAEVARLTAWTVTPAQWTRLLDKVVPIPGTDVTKEASKRAISMVEAKREKLVSLYTHDARVSPWKDTAFGVLQAFNTYATHESTVRGATRAERNMNSVLTGASFKADAEILEALATVTS